MQKNIKVEQAADLLGKCPQFVRLALQQQRLPIGVAVKGKARWSYHISIGKLAAYMGLTQVQVEKLLTE